MDGYLRRILARLGALDPITTLSATPTHLESLLERLGPSGFGDTYAPGKWPARTIVAHLADVELGMGFRLRQALSVPAGDPPHAVQPFDQDAWATRSGRLDPSVTLEAFRALRALNLSLLATLDFDDWSVEAFHPERGFESVDLMVRFLAGHDLNHLDQVAAIAGVR